jgi:hypothetical protein
MLRIEKIWHVSDEQSTGNSGEGKEPNKASCAEKRVGEAA